MINIVVCHQNMTRLQELFNNIRIVLEHFKVRCELTMVQKIDVLRLNTKNNPFFYDILVLDSSNEDHLRFSSELRRSNFYASIIFEISPLIRNDILRYRPSAVINQNLDPKMIVRIFKSCINEQLYVRPYFLVKKRDVIVKIPYNDIICFESSKRIVSLVTSKEITEFYSKLNDLETQLPRDIFIRCHRSYIVNIRRMSMLDKVNRCFIADNKKQIDISKIYFQSIVESFSDR